MPPKPGQQVASQAGFRSDDHSTSTVRVFPSPSGHIPVRTSQQHLRRMCMGNHPVAGVVASFHQQLFATQGSLCDRAPTVTSSPRCAQVVVPEVEGSDKLIGQMLEVEVASLKVGVRVPTNPCGQRNWD